VTGKGYVHDLCASDEDKEDGDTRRPAAAAASSSSATAHNRKRPRDQDEDSDDASFATCVDYSSSSGDELLDDADGSTYNIRDIKAGKGKAKAKGADERKRSGEAPKSCSAAGGAGVYSLFDLHKAKKKGASKAQGKKGSVGNAANEGDASSDRGSSTSDGTSSGAAAMKAKSVGQKIIVFFHHKAVLSAIEDSLLQMQVKFIKIDGATTQARRAKLIDQFQNDNVVSIFVMSPVYYCPV
jgi:SNF2 family DNA or RNA helicase